MKRKNLFPLFLMTLIIWGMSACTTTGPLTKCPDMKPQSEKQIVLKTKNKKKSQKNNSEVKSYVAVNTNITDRHNTSVQPIQALRQKQWNKIALDLSPKVLANTIQPISLEIETSIDKSLFVEQHSSKRFNVTASNQISQKTFKIQKKETRQIKQIFKKKQSSRIGVIGALFILILAIIPPLAMYIYDGGPSKRFWLSVILTLIGLLPGYVYTAYIILTD